MHTKEDVLMVNAVPTNNTDFQLLMAVIPDIEDRLKALRRDNPAMFEEIRRRALSKEGWKPLEWWQGAF